MSISKFERNLMALNPDSDNFSSLVYDLLDQIPKEDGEKLIPVIFKFFEKYSLSSTGGPGALIHHVEKYYPRYKNQLFESVKCCPSLSSIFMLNRILNTKLLLEERNMIMKILFEISNNEECNQGLRNDANDFIAYQNSK